MTAADPSIAPEGDPLPMRIEIGLAAALIVKRGIVWGFTRDKPAIALIFGIS